MAASGNGGAAPYHGGGLAYLANEGNPLGQSPGTFFHRVGVLLRGRRQDARLWGTLADGTIREFVMPIVNAISGGSAFNWTRNANDDAPDGVNGVDTNPVRYRVSTAFLGQGNQLSNPRARSFVQYPSRPHAPNPVFLRAGQQQGKPTIRNRITSFGSRVPPINQPLPSEQIGG